MGMEWAKARTSRCSLSSCRVYNYLLSNNALRENKTGLALECWGTFCFVTGELDEMLPWPFRQRVTLTIIDQAETDAGDMIQVFQPDPASSSFKQPTKTTNLGSGYAKFMSQEDLYKPGRAYVRQDCMAVKIVVDLHDLEV